MCTAGTSTFNTKRHAIFAVFILLSNLAMYRTVIALVHYSLHNPSSSHIILIPLIAFYMLYLERKSIFSAITTSTGSGVGFVLGGVFVYWLPNLGLIPREGNWPLFLETFSLILVWVGGFLFCYGFIALQAAAFPILFLLLMVPLPDVVLDRAIYALQEGSTEIAYLIFQAARIPVLRNGFLLSVPGITIEVAKECSSIRSSIALFVVCLLAAHLYIRTRWKILFLVALGVLLSVVKNGIRIATLTLLSIYVNPAFLTGRLHPEGGFVFFLMTLLMLWPVFVCLEKSDKPPRPLTSTA